MIDPIKKLRERIQYRKDCRDVFSTPEGKRVLLQLCRITGITHRKMFSQNEKEVMWQEAQRHLVYGIIRESNISEEDILERIAEIERSNQDDKMDQQSFIR